MDQIEMGEFGLIAADFDRARDRPDTKSQAPQLLSLKCPRHEIEDERIRTILAHGNLPLLIGDKILAEISQQELQASWEIATTLSPKELSLMTRKAANVLTTLLAEKTDLDVVDVVTDAAVLFLLAMRRLGVADAKRIPACTINWSDPDQPEQVSLIA